MTPLDVPRLHLIGPLATADPVDYLRIMSEALSGGCDAVHIRLPGFPAQDILILAIAARQRLEEHEASLIVNDRLDVAMLVGANGVQLGERGIDVTDARWLVRDAMLIGRSVHDVEGAIEAERDGADYLIAGHIFETNSKAGQPGRGLDWLREVVSATSIPVIAIGGISIDRLASVLETGAHGVAMGREILNAKNPQRVTREAAQIIEQFGGR